MEDYIYQSKSGESKPKMSGMSKGEDLISVWNKFKSDTEPDLEVKWIFGNPEYAFNEDTQEHPHGCVYIMNLRSLYNPRVPGHWVALVKVYNPNMKEYGKIYYYDPFGTILSKKGTDKLKCRYIYESVDKEQNFKGIDSDSCGYFCILFLLSWLRRFKKYNYAVFDNQSKRFIDTSPNNNYIKMNVGAMQKELDNNEQSSLM